MSLHTKLILPLIDKSLKLEDLSYKTGFVDAYTLDINRPSLTNHVFLLYKRVMTPESIKTREKLSKLSCFYNKKNMKINNVLYVLFSFTINSKIKLIKNNGCLLLVKDDKANIGKFWSYTDVDVTDFLLGFSYLGDGFKDDVVPEEDYSPSDFITYNEKRGELVISSSL